MKDFILKSELITASGTTETYGLLVHPYRNPQSIAPPDTPDDLSLFHVPQGIPGVESSGQSGFQISSFSPQPQ